jgi:hypothetical protein
MVSLGVMGWKEIILIIIGYMIIRFVLSVRKARKTVLNMKDQMEKEMHEANRSANRRPEGEISIDKSIGKEKKKDSDSGDYVDFEEVD